MSIEQKIKCTLVEALCLHRHIIQHLVDKTFLFLAELKTSFSQSLFKEDDLKKIQRLEKFIKVKTQVGQDRGEIFFCWVWSKEHRHHTEVISTSDSKAKTECDVQAWVPFSILSMKRILSNVGSSVNCRLQLMS